MFHKAISGKAYRWTIITGLLLFIAFLFFQFTYIFVLLLGLLGSLMLGIIAGFDALNLLSSIVSASALFVFLVLMTIALVVRNTATKAVCFNVGFVFLAICIFETYLHSKRHSDSIVAAMEAVKVTVPEGFWQPHPFLGSAPDKAKPAPITSYYEDELLYKVTYTIDSNSHRITPPFVKTKGSRSVVFFGCSVTFGYGLEDHEAFPYIVGQKLPQYKVYNFAFGGYGTHQMLAALEHGIVDEVVDIEPEYVIYTAIPDHLRRIVNNISWGGHDPKYVLKDGKAQYAGQFDDNISITESIRKKIKESLIFSELFGEQMEDQNVKLFGAIVAASQERVKQMYPNSKFIIVFWDDEVTQKRASDKMIKELHENNMEFHLISDILPDYWEKFTEYQIRYPMEPHPNYMANKYIADYIVESIIKQDTAQNSPKE